MTEKIVELLKKLIEIKNPTLDVNANQKALEFCQTFLENRGIKSKIVYYTKHPTLEWGASPDTTEILLNTHIDVVPAPESCFKPKESNGKMFGRGSADTKAMVAVFLLLSTPTFFKKNKTVRFVLVSDEEIGGDTTKAMLPKLRNIKFSLFGEPTQLKMNNEAKGIMQIKIVSSGTNAHGSRPWEGDNSIISMMKQLQDFLTKNPVPTKYTWETTYNFSQINGGVAINQVPSLCELFCDVRYKPSEDPQKIVDHLGKFFKNARIEIIRNESPILTKKNNPYLQKLKKIMERHGLETTFSRELGSSDARHCTNIGIPTIVFGPKGGGLHQDDEWVDVSTVYTVLDVLKDYFE